MGFFNETIATALAGHAVRVSALVKFDFQAGPIYLWNGNGPLESSGQTWEGLRGIGKIDGLEQSMNATAPEMQLTIAADERAMQMAQEDPEDFVGRIVTVFMQFFDDTWQLLDNAHAIQSGVMSQMECSRKSDSDSAGWVRTITVVAEGYFTGRGRPPYGYFSDRDQQSRYPGDLFFERVAGLQNKIIARWPDG